MFETLEVYICHRSQLDLTVCRTSCVHYALRTFLAKNGFDPQMGARPMARLIQDTIRKALADELLFGRLTDGGEVTVTVEDDKVALQFKQEEVAEPL